MVLSVSPRVWTHKESFSANMGTQWMPEIPSKLSRKTSTVNPVKSERFTHIFYNKKSRNEWGAALVCDYVSAHDYENSVTYATSKDLHHYLAINVSITDDERSVCRITNMSILLFVDSSLPCYAFPLVCVTS
jgi:hypothetical protein